MTAYRNTENAFLPPPLEELQPDSARVIELVPLINTYLAGHFDRQNRQPVFVPLTPAFPKRKLEEERHLTEYPFGEPLNRAQLAKLQKEYEAGWEVRPVYCSMTKHQLVFTPK